ncbi:uncharacterized protein LOC133663069 [Entelurus aequoreus]|uniref:uncharacterized protein LOC133663069 n=1 Tax=Entelurus aequoreus TaxID=161455 RepID=UPI002B1D5DAD|nr:uncharacterized protein LOC133663069 [Entelurus aequoreus]
MLIVIFIPTQLSESAEIRGEIGGNVTIPCPVDEGKNITFFYLQKKDVFVNGFNQGRDVKKAWPNSRVVKGTTTVQMFHLNASHNGEYECIICYDGMAKPEMTYIHLIVTANYSTPTFTKSREGGVCNVSCDTDGGYPSADLTLDFVDGGNITWLDVRRGPNQPDPDTGLYRNSIKASYNCSDRERKLRCSAGDVTASSDPDPTTGYIPVVIGVIFAVVLIVGVLIGIYKRRQILEALDRCLQTTNAEEGQPMRTYPG